MYDSEVVIVQLGRIICILYRISLERFCIYPESMLGLKKNILKQNSAFRGSVFKLIMVPFFRNTFQTFFVQMFDVLGKCILLTI